MVDDLKGTLAKSEIMTRFVGNVLGNAAFLDTWFPPSSSGKWLKISSWHDHRESQYRWQSAHLRAPYTRALKVELVDAF